MHVVKILATTPSSIRDPGALRSAVWAASRDSDELDHLYVEAHPHGASLIFFVTGAADLAAATTIRLTFQAAELCGLADVEVDVARVTTSGEHWLP